MSASPPTNLLQPFHIHKMYTVAQGMTHNNIDGYLPRTSYKEIIRRVEFGEFAPQPASSLPSQRAAGSIDLAVRLLSDPGIRGRGCTARQPLYKPQ
jgi:hypothetical protein